MGVRRDYLNSTTNLLERIDISLNNIRGRMVHVIIGNNNIVIVPKPCITLNLTLENKNEE